MPFVSLDEAELYYEVRGDGEPLVLVPGFASGAWSWDWQVEELARDFRVVTFDPRGVANSKLNNGPSVSISKIADDIVGLLDNLDMHSAHMLGISFGGFVAQEFALRYPERLKRLVLASTSLGGPNHVAPATEVLAAFASTVGLNSSERIRKYLTMAFTPTFIEKHAEVIDRFCTLREHNAVPEEVYRQQLASAVAFDAERQAPCIQAETLVLTGDADTVVPAENSKRLARAIPHATLGVIEDGGHMTFVEQAEEFNSFVRDFLARKYKPE
jgi:pimeloyl-ACP methyl ester carboxylesterase